MEMCENLYQTLKGYGNNMKMIVNTLKRYGNYMERMWKGCGNNMEMKWKWNFLSVTDIVD